MNNLKVKRTYMTLLAVTYSVAIYMFPFFMNYLTHGIATIINDKSYAT